MQEFIQKYQDQIVGWITTSGLTILGILIVSYIVYRYSSSVIEKVVARTVVRNNNMTLEEEKRREDTLSQVFDRTLKVSILIVAGMMVLSEVGINVGPVIAAAGVAGLAFGFGGQYLIRDIISGLFIILENQYRVGDVVCLDKACGLVESINLRLTIIRDLDGTVHHIPNGEIKKASNLSKHFSRVNLNIGIAYSTNLEKAIEVIDRVGEEIAQDEKWKNDIIKAPKFLRVNDFADSAIEVKILGDTKPLRQWDVTGELRKRLKIAFDKEGIEIPFPQRVVHYSDQQPK